MYERNVGLLEKKINEYGFVRNISKYLKEDGSFDYEGNLSQWDEACRDFEKIYLWPHGEEKMTEGAGGSYELHIMEGGVHGLAHPAYPCDEALLMYNDDIPKGAMLLERKMEYQQTLMSPRISTGHGLQYMLTEN